MHLQKETLLQGGKYRIEKVLGQGGFGITYLAEQVMLGRKVCVKEFFMKELCERDKSTQHVSLGMAGGKEMVDRFREKFLKEARNIARMKHPNIVSIIDVFEENDTAYYVMEYAECGSLSAKVKSMGYMPVPMAVRYILQVASALDYIHRHRMNHFDVKPSNIMLNEEGNAILIDFGLSKQYGVSGGSQTSSTPLAISEGYAPLEQYKKGGVNEFSPETDIYALGATFFMLLTGTVPPSASDINEDGVPVHRLKSKGVSQGVINLICWAMEPRKKSRMSSATAFIAILKREMSSTKSGNDAEEATLVVPSPKPINSRHVVADNNAMQDSEDDIYDEEDESDHTLLKNGIIIVIILAIITAIYFGLKGMNIKAPAPSSDSVAVTAAVSDNTPVDTVAVSKVPVEEIVKEDEPEEPLTVVANGVSFNIIPVKSGTFTMGAHKNQMAGASSFEKVTHRVTLSSYYIGETEVTQALWKAVMEYNPSNFIGDDLPVESVSWYDCQEFINRLNALTGKQFRLPTEAEWEFAARGGNRSMGYIYSGSNSIDDVAWFRSNSGIEYLYSTEGEDVQDVLGYNECETHPVAVKQPNELGLYDMSGNVWEWCQDRWGNYSSAAQTNPKGPSSGAYRVRRGGNWGTRAKICCTSDRNCSEPQETVKGGGFRLALSM